MTVDVLAIGPHPDDIELCCGGTLSKLARQGLTFAMADLTQGELGTRGTKELRAQESAEAAKILGAVTRTNLRIPDGNIELNQTNLHKVITLIREFQPRILLIPYSFDRHPDHVHCHQLCREAWFYSGLRKIATSTDGKQQSPFRPDAYFEYMQWFEFIPTFIVDITETFETKLASAKAHVSQFHNPSSDDPQTKLSDPEFFELLISRAKYYGQHIGTKYGEPFYTPLQVGIRSLFDLVVNKG